MSYSIRLMEDRTQCFRIPNSMYTGTDPYFAYFKASVDLLWIVEPVISFLLVPELRNVLLTT